MLQQTERGLDTQLVFLTSFHEALLNAKKRNNIVFTGRFDWFSKKTLWDFPLIHWSLLNIQYSGATASNKGWKESHRL